MRVGLTASSVVHGSIILLMLVSLPSASPFDQEPESMPVDIISASDFTKLTKGDKTGKKEEPPKVVAEKVDATEKPVDDPKQKVSEKTPVEATAPPPPPPPAQEQKPQPTPPKAAEQAPPPKEQPKPEEALKSEPLKQEQAKPEPKVAAAAPMPPKKPPPPRERPKPVETASTRDFNADQIKQLLDKRDPTRQAATSAALSNTSSLGAARGDAAHLSQSEIDAFRARLRQCWNTQGLPNDQNLFVLVNVSLNVDGTIAGQPEVLEGQASTFGPALRDSALRALYRCQPYTMLRKETYSLWKSMELKFTPNMFDG